MNDRHSPLVAVVGGAAALVLSIGFGTETFARKVVEADDGSARAVLQALRAPDWRFFAGPDVNVAARYCFVVLFPVVTTLLILAIVRRGIGFLGAWTAAIAAGTVVGFLRGVLLSIGDGDRFIRPGASAVDLGFTLAGPGATYGMLVGLLVGAVVSLAGLLFRGSSEPARPDRQWEAAGSPPSGAWPVGATNAPPPPAGWSPPPSGSTTPPTTGTAGPPSVSGRDDDPTMVQPPIP